VISEVGRDSVHSEAYCTASSYVVGTEYAVELLPTGMIGDEPTRTECSEDTYCVLGDKALWIWD
jgi:hypothetical protein